MWDWHMFKGALKSGVFTLKAYIPKSPSGPLPPDSGSTQKKFKHTDSTYELCNAHNYSIVFKIPIIVF